VALVIALGTPADLYMIEEPSAYLDSEQRISAAKDISRSNCVLEVFGNARTVMNDNSSRFGKFLKMSYDGSARLLGGTVTTYLLEKTRVVKLNVGGRNYHVFHALLEGVTDAQRKRKAEREAELERLTKEQDNQLEQAPEAFDAQPLFPLQVMVNGETKVLDAVEKWTESDVKMALAANMGRPVRDCYLVFGGKPLKEGTTLGALGLHQNGQLELCHRQRSGSPSTMHARAYLDEHCAPLLEHAATVALSNVLAERAVDPVRRLAHLLLSQEEPAPAVSPGAIGEYLRVHGRRLDAPASKRFRWWSLSALPAR
jgi:hypothetical protein